MSNDPAMFDRLLQFRIVTLNSHSTASFPCSNSETLPVQLHAAAAAVLLLAMHAAHTKYTNIRKKLGTPLLEQVHQKSDHNDPYLEANCLSNSCQ